MKLDKTLYELQITIINYELISHKTVDNMFDCLCRCLELIQIKITLMRKITFH